MAEGSTEQPAGPPLDLRTAARPLGSVLHGYGLTPAAAKERAAVVRAVTSDRHIRQRPMPVVLMTGLIALIGLAVWAWQLYLAWTDDAGLTPLFWIGLATFLGAAAVCSWAWQLYDVRKAVVMWLAIVALSLAAAVVIVIVLVALKGDGDADLDLDLDGLVDAITGSGGEATAIVVDEVVAPVVLSTVETIRGGGEPLDGEMGGSEEPLRQAPPGTPACPSCGRALTPGLLVCPRCGASLG